MKMHGKNFIHNSLLINTFCYNTDIKILWYSERQFYLPESCNEILLQLFRYLSILELWSLWPFQGCPAHYQDHNIKTECHQNYHNLCHSKVI
jgi:hypothetical protein